jgi:FtsH-binding integral membrane protein
LAQTERNSKDELDRRQRASARLVSALLMLTLALVALALAITPRLPSTLYNPAGAPYLLFVVLFLGLGSIIYRRTKFATMRLRDIAALRGASGLLDTLQRTTVHVALAGGLVAVLAFVFALMTGRGENVFYPAVIAVAVLLYGYPRRAAWRSVLDALTETL